MKKFKLDPESLAVTSFDTSGAAAGTRGTVRGHLAVETVVAYPNTAQPGCHAPTDQPGCYEPSEQPGCYFPTDQPGCYEPSEQPGCYFPSFQPGCYFPSDQPGCWSDAV
jgi:hypothetical protein